MFPSSINLLGIPYKIILVENASEVDSQGRQILWGQIDFWKREIRILNRGRSKEDMFETLFHEILHGIISELHLKGEIGSDSKENEAIVAVISQTFFDTLNRNNLLNLYPQVVNATIKYE